MNGKEIKNPAIAIDLGNLDYRKCWSIQHEVHLARMEERLPDSILIVEHPHVFTVGKKGTRVISW